MVPYVNIFGGLPEQGWPEFFDTPRYSSGFAALWNTFGFITETHMLKPFRKRVESTYALMESFIEFTTKNCTVSLIYIKYISSTFYPRRKDCVYLYNTRISTRVIICIIIIFTRNFITPTFCTLYLLFYKLTIYTSCLTYNN